MPDQLRRSSNKMNSWLIEEWEFDSEEGSENFRFSIASRLPLWLTQPLVQCVLEPVSLFLMSSISEATYFHPSGASVTQRGRISPAPHIFRGVVLSEARGLSLYCNIIVVSMSNCTYQEIQNHTSGVSHRLHIICCTGSLAHICSSSLCD